MTPTATADRVRLPSTTAVATFAVAAALLACAAPLFAYAGSLALFGVPHALTEMRYVDGRFGRRLRSSRGLLVIAILAAVVALRTLSLTGRLDAGNEYVVELGLVAVLAFAVVPDLESSPVRAAVAVGVGIVIATGSAVAPWTTVVVLAILHNATPVGFLAERLSGTSLRRPAMRTCALLFVAVPALIATGWPVRGVDALGLYRPDAAFPSAGSLASHLRVFVPPALLDAAFAPHLFAAAAYMQLLHYGIVIGVLPRLLGPRGTPSDAPLLPWPRASWLALLIAGGGAIFAFGFARDFVGTRAAYGLLASVHAWIEIPVLLLALAARPPGPAARAAPLPAAAAASR